MKAMPIACSDSIHPLRGQRALVTGGAGGLGLGCARRLARLGADLLLVDVNAAAADDALQQLRALGPAPAQHRFERLDLADPADIERLGRMLCARGEPLHLLINNAGIYPPSQRTLSAEGHELTLAIAHFGHFRLTHALWPLLQAAGSARVVSVSSLVQRRARLDLDDLSLQHGYQPIRAYQQAKLANLLLALELQRRLAAAGSAIRSYAAHPGVTRTAIGRNRRVGTDDRWHQRLATKLFAYWQSRFGLSPEQGAESLVLAATGDFDAGSFIGPGGFLEAFGAPAVLPPGPAASDAGLAGALWAHSEALTGLRWRF